MHFRFLIRYLFAQIVREVLEGDPILLDQFLSNFPEYVDQTNNKEKSLIAGVQDKVGHYCHKLDLIVGLPLAHFLL
jgi:hypothetical protein